MSDIPDLPEFDDVADSFLRLGALHSPSELQGYLTGQLAVGSAPTGEEWLSQASDYLDALELPAGEDSRRLLDVYAATRAQLESGDFDLMLLLPGEDIELDRRLESLGHWCQGFLAGFALGGKTIQQSAGARQYSSDVADALRDMAAISQAGLSDEEAEDDDLEALENDFFEVGEHVRMAAITVYLECRELAAADMSAPPGPLH